MKLKNILLEIEEMMQGDFSNANPNKGSGRRFIPPNIDIPKDFIKSVNEEPNGPHIKLIGNPQGEKFLLISSYLKLALEESKRGRTSRDSLMQQNKLLKRFNELIEKYPPNVRMFKGMLKKSLENQRLRDTPFGKFFVSELIVDTQTEKDAPYIRIKNPSQTGMAGGLEAPGMFENKQKLNKEVNPNQALTDVANRIWGEGKSFKAKDAPFPMYITDKNKKTITKHLKKYKNDYKDEVPNVVNIMGMKKKDRKLYDKLIDLLKQDNQ